MLVKPLYRLWREGRLSALLGVGAGLNSFYKLTWLSAAGEAGLLRRLASGPAALDAGQGREALVSG